MRELARQHRLLVGILAGSLVLRIAMGVAYGSALFYSDSWAYADFAYDDRVVRVAADRPIGYSLILRVLALPARELWTVTTLQHLAGLATGVLVYALLLRLGLRRVWAAVAAAVVVLDAYLIVLEHTLMPEAFFGLAVVAGAFLTIGRDRSLALICAGGLLIGAAATIRTVGVFAVPVWLVYVLWAHRELTWVRRGAAAAAIVAPILVYGALHQAGTGQFGLSQTQGWFLYGRIAEIADCGDAGIPAETRFLCERTPADRKAVREDAGPLYWIWNPQAPPRRRFKMSDPRANELLGAFAKAIIRDQPAAYTRMVLADFGRFFTPGVGSKGTSDVALQMPDEPRLAPPFFSPTVRAKFLPSYEPVVRAPSGALRAYADVVHTPRWLLAVLTLLGLVVVLAALVRRPFGARHREVFLLSGMAVAMLLGAAATSEFVLRYLVPVVPLLLAGGAAALADAVPAIAGSGRAVATASQPRSARRWTPGVPARTPTR